MTKITRYSKSIFPIMAAFFAFAACFTTVLAATTTPTTASQTINSGSLTVAVLGGTTTLPSINVANAPTTTTGTLSQVNVDDKRGTAAGWTLSMNFQHLTWTKDPSAASGNTSPSINFSSGSRYDGTCGVTAPANNYTLTIASGGSVGGATYTVTGGCTGETLQSNVTTQSLNATIGSRGIKTDFPAGTYLTGDNWSIVTDVYPYTDMYVTPQTPTASEAGSDLTNVTAAGAATLSGSGAESSSKILLNAAVGYGMGSYLQDVTLRQSIHTNSYAGAYSATLTITISS